MFRNEFFLFFFLGVMALVSAQSQAEIELYDEILVLEQHVYNLEKSVEERLALLKRYLAKIEISLELFPQGSFATPLKVIQESWQTWNRSTTVTFKGFTLQLPQKKGLPKPDLYLKGFVNEQVVFQTRNTKNKYSIQVEDEISFSFKTGDTIRFEIWDKDLFKDDLLDSVTLKSVCLQELTKPLETQYKHFFLQLNYQVPIPKLQTFLVSQSQSQYSEGLKLFKDHRYHEAIEILTPLAEDGYSPAQAKLGECFLYGKGVSEQPLVAKVWFQKAVAQEQMDGYYFLGFLALYKGLGEKTQGILWLETASKRGHAEAQYELGKEYWEGKILPQNSETALSLLEQSQKGGNAQAKLLLEHIKK
ncbi:MAG: hypothetical protein AABZ60_21710 [Planctomycetota bacterium]